MQLIQDKFKSSWVAAQADFENLSLETKYIFVKNKIFSKEDVGSLTSAMVTDLDLCQEQSLKKMLIFRKILSLRS